MLDAGSGSAFFPLFYEMERGCQIHQIYYLQLIPDSLVKLECVLYSARRKQSISLEPFT